MTNRRKVVRKMTKADVINQIVEICCQKNTPEEKELIRRGLFVINKIKYKKLLTNSNPCDIMNTEIKERN